MQMAPRPPSHWALPLLAALAAAVSACGTDAPTAFADGGMDANADATVDARPPPIDLAQSPDAAGRVCTRSSQCDDGIDCTMDFCSAEGRCASVPNQMACDDGVYCNGLELCDGRRGCVRGTPVSCNDNYACTVDRCDEVTKTCVSVPRDFDRDGDPDLRCQAEGCDAGTTLPDGGACWVGGDCDDSDPRVSSRTPEICGDGIDNNCNGAIDTAEPAPGCQRAPSDACEDARDVSAGGRFVFALPGTTGNYTLRCSPGMLSRDVVARFRLTEPHDVQLSATVTSASVYMQVTQARCGAAAMPADIRTCTQGYPSTSWRARALPAGEYFVVMGHGAPPPTAPDLELSVTISPATPPPPNDTCATPTVIPPTGGTFTGDLIDVASDVTTSCGGAQPDVVYSITLPAAANVSARLVGGSSAYLTLALTAQCARMPTSTLRCNSGSPAQFTARQLAAGTYYLVVQGNSLNPYTLEVGVTPPSPPPHGDACADPLTIAPGATAMGTFDDLEADYQLSCSGTGSRDVVYRFTLTERSDVTASVRGGLSDYYYLALQANCGDRTTERACRTGSPGRLTVLGLDPGTYYVIAKSIRAGGAYTLTLDARPPVMSVTVAGNDTCGMAFAIPSGGGVYMGTTAPTRHDYTASCSPGSTSEDVVFHYTVDRRQRVSFSTEGSTFDTILWLTTGARCPGDAVPGACNDDAIGVASAFDVTLDPGEYYLFLGGFGSGARGNYMLSVTPSTATP